jgi:hypothetical protein
VLRWIAGGMGEAAKHFRRVNGYLHLPARCRSPSASRPPRRMPPDHSRARHRSSTVTGTSSSLPTEHLARGHRRDLLCAPLGVLHGKGTLPPSTAEQLAWTGYFVIVRRKL